MKNTILIKPKFVNDVSSYWAMFYCAILKTIYHQKNLKFNFDSSSLETYRGKLTNPSNFFNQMRGSINNHGFEYLMIDYLRSSDGIDITKLLIERLLKKRGITDFEPQFMNIYKVGEDSKLHSVIETYSDLDVKIFVPANNYKSFSNKCKANFTYNIGNIAKTFIHSDLLLLISDEKKHTYGFVGEVEGLHGEKLLGHKYWENFKARYSTFAIGTSDRKKAIEQIMVKDNVIITEDFGEREILHFSDAIQLIKDFKIALNNIELCLNGHYSNISLSDDTHNKIFKLIKNGWSKPLNEVINEFEKLIDYSTDPEMYTQSPEDSIFKPSIIASVDKFSLYKLKF